jgi:hypothetical protein
VQTICIRSLPELAEELDVAAEVHGAGIDEGADAETPKLLHLIDGAAIASARTNFGAQRIEVHPGKPISTCSWMSVRPSASGARPGHGLTARASAVMGHPFAARSAVRSTNCLRRDKHGASERRRDVDRRREAPEIVARGDLDHAERPQMIRRELHVEQSKSALRNQSTSSARAIFEAFGARWNFDSAAKKPPIATP